MKIAQIAPLAFSIPPKGYGGVERVVSVLTEELVRRGHDVTLFASGDSTTSARLIPMVPTGLWEHEDGWPHPTVSLLTELDMLSNVYSRTDEFDVIHSHADINTLPFARLTERPTVMTLHGRLDLEFLKPIYARGFNASLISLSFAQRNPLSNLDLNWVGNVPNPIAISAYDYSSQPGKYLAFVGRITRDKGPEQAVRVSQAVGLPLKAAGVIHPVDQSYWEQQVRPLFEENDVEFLGEISDGEKGELYGGALATLFPSDWPEPFGLVILESLACGTPVVALDRGAVREIMSDGVHGFACADVAGMIRAFDRIGEIDRAVCRERAAYFSPEHTAQAYENVYRSSLA